MASGYIEIEAEADAVASHLFGENSVRRGLFARQLKDIWERVQGKEVVVMHHPGGWGNTPLESGQPWEKSLVEGIGTTVTGMGYESITVQYFRTDDGFLEVVKDIREQTRHFAGKAIIMAAELNLVTRHLTDLKVVMVGVSQGAAFSNAVLQQSRMDGRLCSIEVGLPFPYQDWRVSTPRTLALNGNGVVPDAVREWDLPEMSRAFCAAPFRWIKYQFQRRPQKFSYCINVPGHDYDWRYPEVQKRVIDFLKSNLGNKRG